MLINSNRVNIVEKDIEDWLWENPDDVASVIRGCISLEWIARQYRIPSGIIDLLGKAESRYYEGGEIHTNLVLVEIKNNPLTSAAVAQIARYAADMECIVDSAVCEDGALYSQEGNIIKLLIAPGTVDDNVLFEANAIEACIHTFDVNLELTLYGATRWKSEARNRFREMLLKCAESPIFDFLRNIASKNAEKYFEETEQEED